MQKTSGRIGPKVKKPGCLLAILKTFKLPEDRVEEIISKQISIVLVANFLIFFAEKETTIF